MTRHTHPAPYPPTACGVRCAQVSSLPNVDIVINGKTYTLTPDDYVIKDENVICLFGFTGQSH